MERSRSPPTSCVTPHVCLFPTYCTQQYAVQVRSLFATARPRSIALTVWQEDASTERENPSTMHAGCMAGGQKLLPLPELACSWQPNLIPTSRGKPASLSSTRKKGSWRTGRGCCYLLIAAALLLLIAHTPHSKVLDSQSPAQGKELTDHHRRQHSQVHEGQEHSIGILTTRTGQQAMSEPIPSHNKCVAHSISEP